MEWIGELERTFATSLYPLRVPIAIGLLVGAVVLVIVARHRGWFAAARRHPGRTGVALAVVLLVGGPVAWYLGSPLFIRTALVEPEPTVGAPIAPVPSAAPAAPASSSSPSPSALAPSPTAAGPTLTPPRTGQFTGADDFHFGSGTASLIETAPGQWTVRFEDFSVRNGPDLYVYLSPDASGYSKQALELGTLKATDGSFNYEVPAGTDVAGLKSVVIWCKQFAVQFAVAPLG
jgi:Electron transfer DM13